MFYKNKPKIGFKIFLSTTLLLYISICLILVYKNYCVRNLSNLLKLSMCDSRQSVSKTLSSLSDLDHEFRTRVHLLLPTDQRDQFNSQMDHIVEMFHAHDKPQFSNHRIAHFLSSRCRILLQCIYFIFIKIEILIQ